MKWYELLAHLKLGKFTILSEKSIPHLSMWYQFDGFKFVINGTSSFKIQYTEFLKLKVFRSSTNIGIRGYSVPQFVDDASSKVSIKEDPLYVYKKIYAELGVEKKYFNLRDIMLYKIDLLLSFKEAIESNISNAHVMYRTEEDINIVEYFELEKDNPLPKTKKLSLCWKYFEDIRFKQMFESYSDKNEFSVLKKVKEEIIASFPDSTSYESNPEGGFKKIVEILEYKGFEGAEVFLNVLENEIN